MGRSSALEPVTLNLVQFIVSLLATISGLIVFSFMTFQTKQEAQKEEKYMQQRMDAIEGLIVDLKVDMKDRHTEIHQDLQAIQDSLIYIRKRADR